MGNNAEIKKRMETYRSIILAIVWIGAAIGLIGGFVIMDSYSTRSFGIILIIISIIGGIISHFLVNVALAIPFILLNNGDILATLVSGNGTNINLGNVSPANILNEFIPTHKVKLLTNAEGLGLRKNPDPSTDTFTRILDGIEVQHLNTGSEIKLQNKKGLWYEIITREGIRGWCFSGSLEKI
ncbi:MAG: SH3 domain-containing protein [Treponema sp.]|jgi:hypothetical protein|nr:SH3 domain-containing protein [Treponema sp.]